MTTTVPRILRRGLYGVFAVLAVGGTAAVAIAMPPAAAAPNPCVASQIARTIGSVSINTGNYLDSHPDANSALTNAAQQPAPQALGSLKTYFDANPQVGKDLQTIQQPLTGLTGQCKLPISVPQALQFLQGAAQNGQLPGAGALPGNAPSAAVAGSAAQPAQVPTGSAELPGVTTSPLR